MKKITVNQIKEEFSDIVKRQFSRSELSDEEFVKETINNLTITFIRNHSGMKVRNDDEAYELMYDHFEAFFSDDEEYNHEWADSRDDQEQNYYATGDRTGLNYYL